MKTPKESIDTKHFPEAQGVATVNNPIEQAAMTVTHVVTDAESSLLEHASKGPINWDHVVAEIGDDYELMKDPMALPPECIFAQERGYDGRKFRFRWLDPTQREHFSMQTSGKIRWFVCNRTNSPFIKSGWDANGLIRNSGLVLSMMPYEMYVKRNKIYEAAAILPKREGAKDGEGRYVVEPNRIKSGDIIVSEEHTIKGPGQEETPIMVEVNQPWTGDGPE